MMDLRVGIGYDIHRFADGKPLMLGGIEIPFAKGLEGHSDADVLLHAVADALLGAIAAGDIGDHFPPDDQSIAGIASQKILLSAVSLVKQQGFSITNVDATVVAESPKIAPFRLQIRQSIASTLELPIDRVSVKATTNEGMGALGRSEGIAALVSALLLRDSAEDA